MAWKLHVAVLLMTGGAGYAAPVFTPPDGFAGSQYIDSKGCVFAQTDDGWAARIDGAGQPLCGFPPSIGVRQADAPEPVAPDAETLLMDQLTQHLRSGEWTADPNPAEIRREAPVPPADPIHSTLKDALAVAPVLRQASGLDVSDDLCTRLGYRPDAEVTNSIAALGLCPGMSAPKAKAPDAPTPRVAAKPVAVPPSAVVARRPAPPAAPKSMLEMIPASARYIQVGAFADGDNAVIVLRELSARGYPVAQTRITDKAKGMRVIMAGPFPDRQKLVEALVALRQTGYVGAMPR
jgi:cell division septation protein DedD